jgi:beta-galactosidase
MDFEFARDRSLVKTGEARGAASPRFDDAKWRPIDVPHDWAIELPLVRRDEREHVEHGSFAIGPEFPQHSVGWYRRRFTLGKSELGRCVSVEFDGVFRDAVVWLNGHRLLRHASGYTPFAVDISDQLCPGENVLVVRVDASQYEGWWYEGAGIYRHVWLVSTSPVHVARDGVCVRATPTAMHADVEVLTALRHRAVADDHAGPVDLLNEALDPDGLVVARGMVRRLRVPPDGELDVAQSMRIKAPRLWSCESPALYTMRTTASIALPAESTVVRIV